jgi:hypothetical protein
VDDVIWKETTTTTKTYSLYKIKEKLLSFFHKAHEKFYR